MRRTQNVSKRLLSISAVRGRICTLPKRLPHHASLTHPHASLTRAFSSSAFTGVGSSYEETGVVLNKPMILRLQDGTEIRGKSFGAQKPMSGEIVFNTGMVGYVESMTDPSYAGQILVMTYPLIGNYGVPDVNAVDEFGIMKYLESHKIQIAGLVVADYSPEYSHWRAKESLAKWLQREGIPAIYGVDTRMITKKVREQGNVLGKLFQENDPIGENLEFVDPILKWRKLLTLTFKKHSK